MEKPLYPSYYMRITQGSGEGTHRSSFAIDDAGKDTGIGKIRAPYTGIIKKIYQSDANEVWLESFDKVEYPDGTIDYMTILFAHANDIGNLFVGKKIAQGEEFYSEGTKGNVTGNHCHFECGRGKFEGTGWYKNNSGYYSINNGKKAEECLWLDSNVTILNNNNYTFRKIETIIPPTEQLPETPPEVTPPKEELPEEIKKEPKLIFTCKKSALYGIYLKENENVYLD